MSESPPKTREISMKQLFDLHKKKSLTGYKVSVVPSTFLFKDGKGEFQKGQPYLLGDFLGITNSENAGRNGETNYILDYKHADGRNLHVTSAALDREHESYKVILESPKSMHQYPIDSKSSRSRSKSRSKSPSASPKTQSNRGGRRRSKRSRKSRR
jgi:hypothetical protein